MTSAGRSAYTPSAESTVRLPGADAISLLIRLPFKAAPIVISLPMGSNTIIMVT